MTRRTLPRGLCVITDAEYIAAGLLANAVQHAIVGGAKIVQYRDSSRDLGRRKHEAATLRDICHEHEALFIVHQDVRLAQDVRADGIHLDRDDTPVEQARRALGPDAIIGVSCYNSVGFARRAADEGADYVTFGSFFPAPSNRAIERAHLDTLTKARDTLDIHIVAAGGITPDNGPKLIRAGADMLAVCGGVFDHREPESAAHHYAALFRL